jgi:hypothetical protein
MQQIFARKKAPKLRHVMLSTKSQPTKAGVADIRHSGTMFQGNFHGLGRVSIQIMQFQKCEAAPILRKDAKQVKASSSGHKYRVEGQHLER